MDTATGDRDVWKRLGRLAVVRRGELGLTQRELAESFGVSTGTIQSLEKGHVQTRRSPTWPKLEAGYGWGPGFIENFTSGLVTDEPTTDGDGRFVRTPRPDGDEDVRDIVRHILGQYAPRTPIGEVLKAEEEAVEEARRRGLIGPDTEENASMNENSASP